MLVVIANQAARAIAELANEMTQRESMTKSAREVLIATLAKVPDPFCIGLFKPITLLNTDYKIVMRIWANRLGPILNQIISHHQKGFILDRDGRKNIIHA